MNRGRRAPAYPVLARNIHHHDGHGTILTAPSVGQCTPTTFCSAAHGSAGQRWYINDGVAHCISRRAEKISHWRARGHFGVAGSGSATHELAGVSSSPWWHSKVRVRYTTQPPARKSSPGSLAWSQDGIRRRPGFPSRSWL